MKILTGRFGEVEIDPARILTFNEGIIGFHQYTRFVFLPFLEGTPFELLQAVDQPDLAFVTINPFLFCEDYQFDAEDGDLQDIQIKNKSDLMIRVIVTMPQDDPRLMTANLQGPVLINEARLLGKQIVLHDCEYTTKHRVFPDAQAG
ncbi:MAG: flagellar assembly protein FliW [Nitrospinae bacterium]|nr:flagellar assembly protein FliW [Nitrospinota bacterium]